MEQNDNNAKEKKDSIKPIDLAAELRNILDLKTKLIEAFEDQKYQFLISSLLKEEEVRQVEQSIVVSDSKKKPFESIIRDCKSQVEQLKKATIVFTLYGKRGVGKSTLANTLLGNLLVPFSENPCTSCPCVISSGLKNTVYNIF
jgi:hypothetical protein